jgi:membrane protein
MGPEDISDKHGRQARTPWRMPLSGWKEILARTWSQTWSDNVGLVAAGVAYYGFLAFVPLLGVLALTYGLIADPGTVVGHMRVLTDILPADVAELIGRLMLGVVQTSAQAKGYGLVAALLVAAYGGSNGAGAIMSALNIAYGEDEKRSLLRFYLIAIVITVAAVLLASAGLATTAAVQAMDKLLPPASAPIVLLGKAVGYALLGLVAAAVAATLYRFGPSREHARWVWITPGSLFTAASWLLLTAGFGFYATRLTDYDETYGSLAAIIMLLTWMYLSVYVFLFGAELNSEIEHQSARDTTTGPPEPLGRRGAWAADEVAGLTDTGEKKGPTLEEAGPPNPAKEEGS